MPNPNERFVDRHIGPGPEDIDKMLATIGAASLDDLIAETIPGSILDTDLDLPPALSEGAAIETLRDLASKNVVMTSLIGLGYHDTITPPVIQRNVLESPAWYTAYTPYQPEISQGRLEALLNFQTMVADLTALDIANASLLDEATAAAEAMAMCRRLAKNDLSVFYVDDDCHLPTIEVVRTRASAAGIEIRMLSEGFEPEVAFGLLLQYPGSSGEIRDHRTLVQEALGLPFRFASTTTSGEEARTASPALTVSSTRFSRSSVNANASPGFKGYRSLPRNLRSEVPSRFVYPPWYAASVLTLLTTRSISPRW